MSVNAFTTASDLHDFLRAINGVVSNLDITQEFHTKQDVAALTAEQKTFTDSYHEYMEYVGDNIEAPHYKKYPKQNSDNLLRSMKSGQVEALVKSGAAIISKVEPEEYSAAQNKYYAGKKAEKNFTFALFETSIPNTQVEFRSALMEKLDNMNSANLSNGKPLDLKPEEITAINNILKETASLMGSVIKGRLQGRFEDNEVVLNRKDAIFNFQLNSSEYFLDTKHDPSSKNTKKWMQGGKLQDLLKDGLRALTFIKDSQYQDGVSAFNHTRVSEGKEPHKFPPQLANFNHKYANTCIASGVNLDISENMTRKTTKESLRSMTTILVKNIALSLRNTFDFSEKKFGNVGLS